MQILHPFTGSAQQYAAEISTPDRYRPEHCPQCQARQPLIAHGFYRRTLVDADFDGSIRVRRYLCRSCRRTVSLLPEFALPYLRFGITVISLFLVARLLHGATLAVAAGKAAQNMIAVPARPVLGPPLPAAGRALVRRSGGVDHAPGRSGLPRPGLAHVAVHRLDRRPPLPVRRSAEALAGLAGVSRSRRSGGRAPARGAARLRVPTQLLSGAGGRSALRF